MNDFLATTPFDIYELNLFQLVAETSSFTRGSQKAGLTQSAITRQIRGMEDRLGVALFERTTRHVSLTPAGRLLHQKSGPILQAVGAVLGELREQFKLGPRILKVGVARSIGLAYLPGYFFAFHRRHPEVQLHITLRTSPEIIASVEAKELDAGLVCPPPHLPRSLQITHRFVDEFTAIAPPQLSIPSGLASITMRGLRKLFSTQRWLLIDRKGFTGQRLERWLAQEGCGVEPAMELDSFDMIVNLVSLGFGVSIVPHRVLPLYVQRRAVRRIATKPRFSRDVAVVVRKNRQMPQPLAAFVETVLF